ncbi:hypothetical protein [Pseudaminobacter sp. NGMCC 1.201702]|uniref:hypothetical protein n=1 Tax=Pseudaminobacter sp. NGMCC 1.201702 TaxID=3391825 RepID=UPI0039EE0ABB
MSSAIKHPLGFKTDGLSICQLYALNDAFRTVFDVLSGLQEQPRFTTEHGEVDETYNKAGIVLDDFCDALAGEIAAIEKIVETKPALTPADYDRKFYLLAQGYLGGTERPEGVIGELSRIASSMGDRP